MMGLVENVNCYNGRQVLILVAGVSGAGGRGGGGKVRLLMYIIYIQLSLSFLSEQFGDKWA